MTASVSVGIDTVQVSEVLASLRTFGARYLDRVFTAHEQASCVGADEDRARGLAARFAAKEATYKALRAHDLEGPLTNIEIRRTANGASEVTLRGAAAAHAERTDISDISVSMTHDAGVATAVAVTVRHDSSHRSDQRDSRPTTWRTDA